MPIQPLILAHHKSPGDIAVLTALVRDLALTHADKYSLAVDSGCKDIWRHNPYLVPLAEQKKKFGVKTLKMTYGHGIREQKHETVHFLNYFHRDFERKTKTRVPLTLPYPDIHLTREEKDAPIIDGRYWIVLSGGKSDATVKVWETKKFQEVAYQLRGLGLHVVQCGDTAQGHWHPPLDGAVNLVGKTNLRDFIRLIHHADGIICGVTGGMHIAAALQRPCVVLGGGREAWWWEAYVRENAGLGGRDIARKLIVPHRYLHTIGLLDCCFHHGCWKNKIDPKTKDPLVCLRPVHTPAQLVPKCMDLITPQHVMDSVMTYYTDKTLPPITPVGDFVPATGPTLLTSNRAAVVNNGANKGKTLVLPPVVKGKLEGKLNTVKSVRVPGKTVVASTEPATTTTHDTSAINHPTIGGKVTICILFYGGDEHHEMHRKCLQAILTTVPREYRDIRVGSNAVGPKTLGLLTQFVNDGTITKHYLNPTNRYKYPVMRDMFHDPECPIETNWVIWFDDDSIADKDPNWLHHLATTIVRCYPKNAHLYGVLFSYALNATQKQLFASRPWYSGRPWRNKAFKPAPNGTHAVFPAGGFWAISREAIQKANVPDLGTGLTNNGGDWQIGEQVYQAGFESQRFNDGKQFVRTSAYPRRGKTTLTPGFAPLPPAEGNSKPLPPPALLPPPPAPPKKPLVIASTRRTPLPALPDF